MQEAVRRKSAAQIEAVDQMSVSRVDPLPQHHELLRRRAVGVGRQDVGADVAMKRMEVELRILEDGCRGAFRFAVRNRKSELRPNGADAGVEPHPQSDLDRTGDIARELVEAAQLVPIVDMDKGALPHGTLEGLRSACRDR